MLEEDGFEIIEGVLDASEVAAMVRHAEASLEAVAGDRNALSWPWVQEIAQDPRIIQLVGDMRPVRAILFDKTPGANWDLGYHQDRALALRERREVDGFTGWSVKDGVPHAIAPASVLERMAAVRISLDPCGLENGPLRVIPGTHILGLVPRDYAPRQPEVFCTVGAGGVVLVKPLLLHASSAATSPSHRRLLHIEFFSGELPGELEFYDWRR